MPVHTNVRHTMPPPRGSPDELANTSHWPESLAVGQHSRFAGPGVADSRSPRVPRSLDDATPLPARGGLRNSGAHCGCSKARAARVGAKSRRLLGPVADSAGRWSSRTGPAGRWSGRAGATAGDSSTRCARCCLHEPAQPGRSAGPSSLSVAVVTGRRGYPGGWVCRGPRSHHLMRAIPILKEGAADLRYLL